MGRQEFHALPRQERAESGVRGQQENKDAHISSRTRTANGILCAALVVALVCHQIAGAFFAGAVPARPVRLLMWAVVVVITVHVALSIATTAQMMTDNKRPPSIHKRRHQALKWVTGILVGSLAAIHVFSIAPSPSTRTALLSALAICLAWHGWVGTKSLLKDLNINRTWRFAVRTAFCVVATVVVARVVVQLA